MGDQNLNLGRKFLKAMSDLAPVLPQELITEILLRLPAKSIGQFRCVSRPWRTLLSHRQFIRAHLNRHIHDPEKLILIDTSDHSPHVNIDADSNSSSSRNDGVYILNFNIDSDSDINSSSSSGNDGLSRRVLCPPLQDTEWTTVEGSCHGLVLLVINEENSKLLINPTTSEIEKVPNFSLALDPIVSFTICGLGYDCPNDDYKIVALSSYDTDNEHEPDCAETFVDIYSLKMKTWRRLENSPYDHDVPHLASGIFVNGTIHWLAASRTKGSASVIAAFNLAHEEFDVVPPPRDVDEDKFVFYELTVLGGCLAMVVDSSCRGSIDVWMMKEYGKQESWNKISINVPDDQLVYSFKPICLLNNEDMVLGKDGEKLVLYNITKGTYKDMVVDGMPEEFGDGILTFTESLLSPNFS